MGKQTSIFASSRLMSGPFKMLVSAAVVLLFISTATQAQQSGSPTSAASVEVAFSAFDEALNAKARDLLVIAPPPSGTVRLEFGAPPGSDATSASALQADRQNIQLNEFERSIERLRALRPILEPLLREEGVPPEVSSVVLVESGAVPTALSPKGARGVWQFMPNTARRYGLTVTTDRDERLDIYKSTRAAARYLRELYAQFGDWSLVFAAYNSGEQTVQRAIDRSGTTDFSQLNRLLPAETRSYVPAVWAALARLGYNGSPGQLLNLSHSRIPVGVFYADSGRSYGGGHQLGQF
jgi:Transglycosylase SLT domain